jgi:phosphoserine phosphatase
MSIEEPTIAAFLARHEARAAERPGVAVFDCDGTVISGDIGEAMFYSQIEDFHFRISPGVVWPDHPRRRDLDRFFARLKDLPAEERHAHQDFEQFADLILSWYFDQLHGGRVQKACADIVRLLAGYTVEEVRALALQTLDQELASPVTTRQLGGREFPRGSRYIRQSLALLRDLLRRGFDVWGVSGSNRWSVERVFERVGVSPDRVLGIGLLERDGVLTPDARYPVPVGEGKINALRERGAAAPTLVVSDSPHDIPLFLHATELRVRVKSGNLDAADFFHKNNLTRDATWVTIDNPTLLENEAVSWLMQQ